MTKSVETSGRGEYRRPRGLRSRVRDGPHSILIEKKASPKL